MAGIAFAVPAPLQYMVDNAARECSSFSAGDECTRCTMPQGWKSIGMGPCPIGYASVEAQRQCSVLKSEFCCTQGHSGGQGDCAGMIVNPLAKECAFTDNPPPAGWSSTKGLCPEGYSWTDGGAGNACVPAITLLSCVAVLSIYTRPDDPGGDDMDGDSRIRRV